MSDFQRALDLDRPSRLALSAWLRFGCVAGMVALAAVGMLLLARRIAGGIAADLPAGLLVVTALLAVGIVVGGRLVWRRTVGINPTARGRRDVVVERAFGWGGSVALGLLALGCSLGRWWDWFVWLPLVGVEQWQLRLFLKSRESRVEGREPEGLFGSRRSTLDSRPSSIPPLAPPGADASGSAEGGGFLLQQLSRVRDEDGVESIHGTLHAEFVTGQRQATLYVGFCPPLGRVPVVEAECVDGPDAELKVAQAFCHGARLEVRLGEAAEETCSVVVEMIAKPQAAEGIERG
jgi:hypothetical protein